MNIYNMTPEEIYSELCKNKGISELEKRSGVWYIENTIDEYRSKPTSYYPTLKEAIEGLKESSDWFCSKGTGTIYYVGFGINSPKIAVYKGGWDNEFGEILIKKMIER